MVPVVVAGLYGGIYGGQSALRQFASVWYPPIVDSALALVPIFTERWLGRALARQVPNPVKTSKCKEFSSRFSPVFARALFFEGLREGVWQRVSAMVE